MTSEVTREEWIPQVNLLVTLTKYAKGLWLRASGQAICFPHGQNTPAMLLIVNSHGTARHSTAGRYLHKPAAQVAAEDIADPLNLHAVDADLQVSWLGSFQI